MIQNFALESWDISDPETGDSVHGQVLEAAAGEPFPAEGIRTELYFLYDLLLRTVSLPTSLDTNDSSLLP